MKQKKKELTLDDLSKDTQAHIKSAQQLGLIMQFLQEGRYSGYVAEKLVEAKEYVAELHKGVMRALETDKKAMGIPALKQAVKESLGA